VDLHPGDVGRDRSRLQIVDYTRSRSPDQHDVIGKQGGIEAARQDVGGRIGPVAPWHRIVKPNPAGGMVSDPMRIAVSPVFSPKLCSPLAPAVRPT